MKKGASWTYDTPSFINLKMSFILSPNPLSINSKKAALIREQ